MTVSYTSEVDTCRGFGCFPKLLLRWRASIYKLLWLDLIVYLAIYYSLSYIYIYGLNAEQQKSFEKVVKFFKSSSNLIPVVFVLGFYVNIVVRRWWKQYMTLPWPDSTAVYVSSLVSGQDERGRLMRRTIMRYVCLSQAIVLSMISPRVKRRFPTLEYIKEAGLLTDGEMKILKEMDDKYPQQHSYWIPIVWATSIVTKARKESRVRDDAALKTLIDSLNDFRNSLMRLLCFDMISIPLVYTQVVTIAVYTFFLATVLGRIHTVEMNAMNAKKDFNLTEQLFPLLTMLEFIFYMGWLKVAESLISPFGDDDDDIELNWFIDRNLTVSYLIVDEMHNEHPELVKDQYWDEIFPTIADAAKAKVRFDEIPRYSTAKLMSQDSTSVSQFIGSTIKKLLARQDSLQLNSQNDNLESRTPPSANRRIHREKSFLNFSEGEERSYSMDDISSKSTNWPQSESSTDDFELLRRQRSEERRTRRFMFSIAHFKEPLPEIEEVEAEDDAVKVYFEGEEESEA